jgi:hypothetical protein
LGKNSRYPDNSVKRNIKIYGYGHL